MIVPSKILCALLIGFLIFVVYVPGLVAQSPSPAQHPTVQPKVDKEKEDSSGKIKADRGEGGMKMWG